MHLWGDKAEGYQGLILYLTCLHYLHKIKKFSYNPGSFSHCFSIFPAGINVDSLPELLSICK